VETRIFQFLETRLIKTREKVQEGDGEYISFHEFFDKTHEFEIFLRDEQIFDSKAKPTIQITDEDLATPNTKPESEQEKQNGWLGFKVNPYFNLK